MTKLNFVQRLFWVTGLEKGYGASLTGMVFAFALGCAYDRYETSRMRMYRDKSALYGRELKEGEHPSWPSRDQYFN